MKHKTNDWPHLPNAPIVEALIDLRVQLPDEFSIKELAPFRDGLHESFPIIRKRKQIHAQLTFSPSAPPAVRVESPKPDGYMLTSADGTEVVQGRLDGYTFSRLRPYRDWDSLRDSARKFWEIYCDVAHPTSISRLAVRYINRLELPWRGSSLSDWL